MDVYTSISSLFSASNAAILGGFCVHCVIGSIYDWGNITTSVTSYLRTFDSSVTYNHTLVVYAVAIGVQGLTILLGGILDSKIGTRLTVTVGGSFLILGTFLSSYAQSVTQLLFSYGIIFGIGLGLSYPGPMLCAVRWRPESKNLVTGIIVAGIGIGAFIFGLLTFVLVNPTSLNTKSDGYFPEGPVTENVPQMFRTLSCIYAVMLTTAVTLLSDPPEDSSLTKLGSSIEASSYSSILVDFKPNINIPPSNLFSLSIAWQLASCMVMTAIGTMYLAGTIKTFGQTFTTDEGYLARVVAISNIFNSVGRIFLGIIADSIGPLQTMILLAFACSILILTYPASYVVGGQVGFAIWTFVILLFGGGNFALYLPITMQIFGKIHAGSNYGMIYIVYSTSIMFTTLLLSALNLDFVMTSYVLSSITFLGFLNLTYVTYVTSLDAMKDYLNQFSLVTVSGEVRDDDSAKEKRPTSGMWYEDYNFDIGL